MSNSDHDKRETLAAVEAGVSLQLDAQGLVACRYSGKYALSSTM